jgi:hypothetical protein
MLAVAGILVPACSQGPGTPSDSPSQAVLVQVPDFKLQDENSISATYTKTISPRDYLGLVPGFYFTHAD